MRSQFKGYLFIFVALATVLVAAGLYVRDRHVAAGLVLGIAGCMKLIGLGVIPALVLLECFQVLCARGTPGAVRPPVLARRRALLCQKPFARGIRVRPRLGRGL